MNKLKHADITVGMRFRQEIATFEHLLEVVNIIDCDMEQYPYRLIDRSDNDASGDAFSIEGINELTYLGLSTDPIPQRGWARCIKHSYEIEFGVVVEWFGNVNDASMIVNDQYGIKHIVARHAFKILDPTQGEG